MNEQLFGKKNEAKEPQTNVMGEVSSLATRLKLAEDRYSNLQKRNKLNEEQLLEFEKDVKGDIRVLTQQVTQMRRNISEMNSKVDAILGELSTVVHKHEFKTVERYIDMWQPMQFITRDEAKRIVQEVKRG